MAPPALCCLAEEHAITLSAPYRFPHTRTACPPGQGLTGTVCKNCSSTNQISAGGVGAVCSSCAAGQLPNDNSTACYTPPPTLDERVAADLAAITAGIADGTGLEFGELGYPGEIALSGDSFPILLSNDKKNAPAAAARVPDGGRIVLFNKERAPVGGLVADGWGCAFDRSTRSILATVLLNSLPPPSIRSTIHSLYRQHQQGRHQDGRQGGPVHHQPDALGVWDDRH